MRHRRVPLPLTRLPLAAERGTLCAARASRVPQPNICCVGDDDQSIYGWRGAEVDNILRFDHDFPGAKVIRLERNYRSTGHILAAASHLIAHNEGRLGKTLRTEDEPGEKVRSPAAGTPRKKPARSARRSSSCSETATISTRSRSWCAHRSRCANSKTASSPLGLPYRVIGGPRFYERAGNPRRPRLSAPGRPAGRRPRLRAHRQRAQARARRRHRQGAARPRPQARHAADGGRAHLSRPTR